MANIDTYLENIMQARYGRDVRQSIHDGIEAINGDAENAVDIATQAKGEAKTAQDSAQAYANQALAHEQQAQIYRNEAEQFKDEAFSGTPEGYEDVVAKVNSLKEHTGTYLAEVGTKEGSALAKRIYGMSIQDGTPTPTSPVDIVSAKADFRCTGKNLIPYPYEDGASKTSNGITYTVNSDGSITAQGTATSNAYLWFAHNFKIKQGVYKGTLNVTGESGNTYVIRYFNDAEGWSYIFYNNTNVTIPSDRVGSLGVRVLSGQTVDLTFKPQLVLATNSDLSYEVNQHTDVTTNLTLRAIEVASTDDYTYERDGKYYIADTVDWSEDRGYEITRRIGTAKASDLTWGDLTTSNLSGVYTASLRGVNEKIDSKPSVYCKYFKSFTWGVDSLEDKDNSINAVLNININTNIVDGATSKKDAFLKWLQTHDFDIEYILRTPTTEPITSEQAQALLSLKTYNEATSITATSDIEPTINLEYATSEMSAKALTGHNEGYIAQELESVYGVKNLISYPYMEKNPNRLGITATVNDDGSVTFNGTATASYQYLFQSTSVANLKLNKGNYILSGCPSGGAGTGYSLKAVANSVTVTDIGNTKNMNITQDNSIVGVYANIASGTVCNNLTFKPMLRPASIQSNEYQPYAMSNHELTVLIKQLQTALIEMGGN